MPSQVLHGARVKVGAYNADTGQVNVIGIFDSISFTNTLDTATVYTLGNFLPQAIEFTASEPVSISVSGFRPLGIDGSAYGSSGFQSVFNLLTAGYIELTVIDRTLEAAGQDGRIFKFHQCKAQTWSLSTSAKSLSSLSISYIGIVMDDLYSNNQETATAARLP